CPGRGAGSVQADIAGYAPRTRRETDPRGAGDRRRDHEDVRAGHLAPSTAQTARPHALEEDQAQEGPHARRGPGPRGPRVGHPVPGPEGVSGVRHKDEADRARTAAAQRPVQHRSGKAAGASEDGDPRREEAPGRSLDPVAAEPDPREPAEVMLAVSRTTM